MKRWKTALLAVAMLVVAAAVGGLVGGGAAIALVRSSYNGPIEPDGRADLVVHSHALGESVLLRVFTPVEYDGAPDRRFPVLWVLDGPGAGEAVHRANQTLSRVGAAAPAIVVAVPNSSAGRAADFRLPEEVLPEGSGHADRLLEFLAREAMPAVQGTFRTDSVGVLIGHSLGGLFVLYAFSERPDLFDGWIAFSPSVWLGDGAILPVLSEALRDGRSTERFLFVSVGEEEGSQMLAGTEAIRSALEDAAPAGLDWHVEVTPGADHRTNPELSYPSAAARFSGH